MSITSNQNIISAYKLSCQRRGQTLFSDLSFSVYSGQALHIKGENGSGKTTLIRMLAGLFPAEDGEITRPNSLAYLGHKTSLKQELSVADNIYLSLHIHNAPLSIKEISSHPIIKSLSIDNNMDVPVHQLSSGSQQKVALASLLMRPETLYLLDEPLTHLDKKSSDFVIKHLQRYCQNGGALIFTHHEELNGSFLEKKTLTLTQEL